MPIKTRRDRGSLPVLGCSSHHKALRLCGRPYPRLLRGLPSGWAAGVLTTQTELVQAEVLSAGWAA